MVGYILWPITDDYHRDVFNWSVPLVAEYTLLTGVTGLLGRYLLRDLLLKDHRLAVVVRPSSRLAATQRVEEIMQFWEAESGVPLPRPVVLEGDITQPFLGLGAEERRWVGKHCTSAMHSAASLTFYNDSRGEPERSNIGGVQHMLQLCREAAIREFHYISTAYVSGLRQGVVMENELQVGQIFRNDYERSKFTAEQIVRSADFIKDLTVYRPAVIAGDSKTGYTSTYHGLYMYLKLMSVLVRNTPPGPDGVRDTPVQFNLTGDEKRNIVTVDWVSEVICHLFETRSAHGRTYHLAPEVPLTPRQIIEAGYSYYNSRGVEFIGQTPANRQPISEIDRNAHENMSMYKEYEVFDPPFDLSNLREHAGHLPCPEIDEPMLHRFLRFGESDRWGKRKVLHLGNCASIEKHCQAIVTDLPAKSLANALVVNLRVTGPGGGDWRLVIQDGQLIGCTPGEDAVAHASFRISSETFWRLNEPRGDHCWQTVKQCLVTDANDKLNILRQLCGAIFGASPSSFDPTASVGRQNDSLV